MMGMMMLGRQRCSLRPSLLPAGARPGPAARANKGAGPGPPSAEILLVAGPRHRRKLGGRVERQRGDSSWLPTALQRLCLKINK